MPDKLQVWSCGGGTQSCAIGALIVQGKLPKPDVCVIADTGRETRSTWEYLEAVLNPALAKVGLNVVRVKASELATGGESIFNAKGTLLIPAYSTQDGATGKLPNFCTTYWKIDVVQRYVISLGHVMAQARKWIGFSFDEQTRWVRILKSQADSVFLPLVEMGVRRRDCVKIIADMGWPVPPPRSRCWMCPNQGDHEWRELKEQRPDEFQKAVELEREMRAVDPDAWLHRSCVPLDQVDFSQPEDLFSRPCDSGMCFV